MRPSRTMAYIAVCLFYFATLAQAAEVRKLFVGDLDLQQTDGGAAETTVSPGGKSGTRIHGGAIPWDNSYTRTIRPGDLITRGPWVDVRAYGFTEATTATRKSKVTDAIAYAAPLGKCVLLPAGRYPVDNTATGIALIDNACVKGAGEDQTELYVDGGNQGDQVIFEYDSNGTKISNVFITGMTLTGTKPPLVASGGSFSNKGIWIGYGSDITIERVRFKDFGNQLDINSQSYAAQNMDIQRVKVRFNEFLGTGGYTPGVGYQQYNGDDFDISHNVFDNVSRCVSLEMAVVSAVPQTNKNGTISFNRFRGGKTADLSATNIYGGILVSPDSTNTATGISIIGNTFTNTNTDNAAEGVDIQVMRPQAYGISIVGNSHHNQNQWGTIVNGASGVSVTGESFYCDGTKSCKGILLQGAAKDISVVSPAFTGSMVADLSAGALTGGHENIWIVGAAPSGGNADGISWTATDNVNVIGAGTNANNFWYRMFSQASDNTVQLWSSGGGGWNFRTTNAAGGLYNRFNISAGADNVLYTFNNGDIILESRPPATSSTACTTGKVAWDASWWYMCISTNTWKKTALDNTSW